MKSIVRIGGSGKRSRPDLSAAAAELNALDSRVELIQALIPLGLEAVNGLLQQEVTALAGVRYQRGGGVPGYARWGAQPGSVYLADQKVAVTVPRVRDVRREQEVPLTTYQGLRQPRRAEEAALRKILKGLSCRSYEACVEPVAETFGLTASSLSRRFRRASARKLAELQERDLSEYDLVGLFLDGKTFGDDQMVIALGVSFSGEKVVLGFVQTATENETVCAAFLRGLLERGLKYDQGLLVVIDGAKGLRKAVDKVFGKKAAVQRCHWHKRENVLSYLPTGLKPVFKRKLSAAYEKPTYAAARAALKRIRRELAAVNASAAASLDEGLEETLTLHRLGLFKELGRSFKTTNCIENLNALIGQRTDKVDCWRNADQKHRWLATTLLDIEPRLRKVCGHEALPRLRAALEAHAKGTLEKVA
ncbi:MAG: transposase [Planctomycetes bacterium]|nr:transposase [Planctomycetota bacterium]